jgi:hypothetical protein
MAMAREVFLLLGGIVMGLLPLLPQGFVLSG